MAADWRAWPEAPPPPPPGRMGRGGPGVVLRARPVARGSLPWPWGGLLPGAVPHFLRMGGRQTGAKHPCRSGARKSLKKRGVARPALISGRVQRPRAPSPDESPQAPRGAPENPPRNPCSERKSAVPGGREPRPGGLRPRRQTAARCNPNSHTAALSPALPLIIILRKPGGALIAERPSNISEMVPGLCRPMQYSPKICSTARVPERLSAQKQNKQGHAICRTGGCLKIRLSGLGAVGSNGLGAFAIITCYVLNFLRAAPRKLCLPHVESTPKAKPVASRGHNNVAIARVRDLRPGRHALAARGFVLAASDASSFCDQGDLEAAALLGTAHEQEVHEVPHPLLQITELPVAPPVLGVKADAEFEHYDVLKRREPASEAAQAHSNNIIAERCRCRRICPIWHVAQKRPNDSALSRRVKRRPGEGNHEARNNMPLLLRGGRRLSERLQDGRLQSRRPAGCLRNSRMRGRRPAGQLQDGRRQGQRPAGRLQDGGLQSAQRACPRAARTSAPRMPRR